jgi:hypothetical protein
VLPHVCYRHNWWVRNALAASLNRVQTVLEPYDGQDSETNGAATSDQEWDLLDPGRGHHFSHNASSARALTQSQARRQRSTTARGRRRTATRRTSCHSLSKWAGKSTRPACSPGSCRWRPRTRLDIPRGTYAEAWTRCTAQYLTGTGASTGLHACTDCRGIWPHQLALSRVHVRCTRVLEDTRVCIRVQSFSHKLHRTQAHKCWRANRV